MHLPAILVRKHGLEAVQASIDVYLNDLKVPIPTWRGLWISALCQPRIGELTLSRCP